MIQVISLRGRGGVRPVGVYVGRPSPLGNPFLVGRHGTQAQVVALYRLCCGSSGAAAVRYGRSSSVWRPSTGAMGS
jgi:hypothetical protein